MTDPSCLVNQNIPDQILHDGTLMRKPYNILRTVVSKKPPSNKVLLELNTWIVQSQVTRNMGRISGKKWDGEKHP